MSKPTKRLSDELKKASEYVRLAEELRLQVSPDYCVCVSFDEPGYGFRFGPTKKAIRYADRVIIGGSTQNKVYDSIGFSIGIRLSYKKVSSDTYAQKIYF